ncbi:hypothetical protein VHUM_03259 [Vanrija humicola]|uniref:Ketoreductase domain-containing protein n=1 Tax=Vanrija humicola TaxID=5417 RepID=A0A7D8V034_VANHU|nr:hypothetical protein VHUM_03259 [Vanrija humicola]
MNGVALVTGGSSGIGAATVKAFLAKGVRRVVIADVSPLEDAVSAWQAEFADAQLLAVKTDVAQESEVVALIAAAVDKFGRIDYAVNCAGVSGGGAFAEFSTETWDRTTGVNERGVFLCMREQLKVMAEQEWAKDERRRQRGAIVSVASLCGQVAIPQSAAYIASKHAVIGLAKSATLEYAGKGIRINCVAPGWIETNMTQTARAKVIYDWGTKPDRTPMGRGGIPEEIADVIVFLCSEEASFVTGTTWNIDGGYMCF